MKYLPILIDIANQDVLVVGGDHIAARKARAALRAGAKVTVLGAAEDAAMETFLAESGCRRIDGTFSPDHLRGVRMIFAATPDLELAKSVSRAAREAGIPVNVADKTALCSFIMPATVDRDPVVVAVSSGADAPIVTRTLRARLETFLPARLGKLAHFVAERRPQVAATFPDFDARRRFWDRFMEGRISTLISEDDSEAAEKLFDELLAAAAEETAAPARGHVAVIGCGPGDPDLLTFKALRHMQQADTAVVDPEVPAPVADHLRRDAEQRPAPVTVDQITAWVDDGKSVVRLGPGNFSDSPDGRREIAELKDKGIHVVAIPGVAAAKKGT